MKSLLGIVSKGLSETLARRLPSRVISTSCERQRRSWMGTPASSVSESAMSCPVRSSGLSTGGVMREASGTWSVSGAQPPPVWPVGSPGM